MQESGDTLIEYAEGRTCRHWYRRRYALPYLASPAFVESLRPFGNMQLMPFSKFSPTASDHFKFVSENLIITGIVNGKHLTAAYKKSGEHRLYTLESDLLAWQRKARTR